MDSSSLHGFSDWVEVGSFILGDAECVEPSIEDASSGQVMFVIRARTADDQPATSITCGGREYAGDVLYIGNSGQLGTTQRGRLRNMRKNDQPTNARIRQRCKELYTSQGLQAQIGWVSMASRHEASAAARNLKEQYYGMHTVVPPWNEGNLRISK